jgi:mannose-1-phosphate guanylyltransferase
MIDPMAAQPHNLWGLVLAGGEGKRVEDYVEQLRGDRLPKQYVNFIGRRSMLEHTYDRAERLIPRPRVLTIVSKPHLELPEVRRQLSSRAAGSVIVQPQNKDTGLGILLPLTYLHKRSADATVVVFPSDHFILEEERFIDHVRLAARAVQQLPSQLVLLGMEAQSAETEYGYIVPTDDNGHNDLCGCRKAAHFVEKPSLAEARLLTSAGALWNTMIMVFKVDNMLHQIEQFYPDLAHRFHQLANSIGKAGEYRLMQEIYADLPPLNFSKDILEKIAVRGPAAISVLPVLRVTWSDWGSPERLLALKKPLDSRGAPPFAARPQPRRPLRPELVAR